MAGADITVALGSPVNYRIESASPNCYYKVTMTNLADARIADVRDVVTDANGVAVASFQHLAVGDYELHARALIVAAATTCKRVSVIQDCSINVWQAAAILAAELAQCNQPTGQLAQRLKLKPRRQLTRLAES